MVLIFPEAPRFPLYETVFWGGFTLGGLIANYTIGLPLFLIMKCCSLSFRLRVFSVGCNFIMDNWYRKITHYRSKLFDFIKDHEKKEHRSEPLRILEIGVGPGHNFEFYPENSLVTSLDWYPGCETNIRSKLKMYPRIRLEKHITGFAEDMSEIPDNEYDVVVTTFTFCSVNNVDTVLKEVHRVLKKGGMFASLDHVAHPEELNMPHKIQGAFVPIVKAYCAGCHLNRDVLTHIKKAGFSKVSYKMYYPFFINYFFRSFLMGVCTK